MGKKRRRKKRIEPICRNCRLFDEATEFCKVTILLGGERFNLPVSPEDHCHMDELGIPVEQVRWWVEDPETGKPTKGDGVVKIEYPEGFFGDES
jgi:hypothetical protein